MSESLSHPPTPEDQKRESLERYVSLAETLSQSPEGFSFPGIDEETREKLLQVDEEYPGYTTPTDEIIGRMQREGIKIVLGAHPESGNVFVLPLLSDDIEKDALFPRHLNVASGMNEPLQALILAHRARHDAALKEAE